MSSIKNYSNLVLAQILNNTPISILRAIEDKSQFHLGKGWGAETTVEEVETIAHFAKIRKIKKVTALDVGGNLGNWSGELLGKIPSAKIIAFEPSKEAYRHLQQRFENNQSFHCVNLALGKENSVATLFADKSASGLGSLTKRRMKHFDIDFSYQEEIQLSTLDSWIQNVGLNTHANVLKIDVEGHELDVLKGASETLKKIEIVQFEFGGTNIDTQTYFQDYWYFFLEIGFDLYRLSPRGPLLIESYSENDETFRPTNYIAVKK